MPSDALRAIAKKAGGNLPWSRKPDADRHLGWDNRWTLAYHPATSMKPLENE